jgi:hypothetical protein
MQVYKLREHTPEELEKIGDNYSKEHKSHICPEAIAIWNNYYIGVIPPETVEAAREVWKRDTDKSDSIKVDDGWLQIIKMDDDPNQALVFYKLDFDKK